MGVPRGLYITFYILYLIALAATIYFVLHYSNVPQWVFYLYVSGFALAFVGLIIKETVMRHVIKADCEIVNVSSARGWSIFYGILHLAAFILIITGIGFTIAHATIPWWPWVLIAIGIVASILASFILSWSTSAVWRWIAGVLTLSALILEVVGLIYVVIYSKAPSWIWGLIAAVIVLGIATHFFEQISEPNVIVMEDVAIVPKIKDDCVTMISSKTSLKKSKEKISNVGVIAVQEPITGTNVDAVMFLPSMDIPEQTL